MGRGRGIKQVAPRQPHSNLVYQCTLDTLQDTSKVCSAVTKRGLTFRVPHTQGHVHAMKSTQLVPGDVIVVQSGQAVCDMVLLQGNALAKESRLTGQV